MVVYTDGTEDDEDLIDMPEQEAAQEGMPEPVQPMVDPDAMDETAIAQPELPAIAAAPGSVADNRQMAIRDYLQKQYQDAKAEREDAVREAGKMNLIAGLGKGLTQMATANSQAHGGGAPDLSLYQDIARNAQANTVSAKDLQTQARGDLIKNYIQEQRQIGQNDLINKKLDTQKDIAKMKADSFAKAFSQRGNSKADTAQSAEAIKQFRGLGKDLDSETASSRSGLGLANNKVNAADRLMAFVHVDPEELKAAVNDPAKKAELIGRLDQLPPQQYAELVTGLMSQLNNGGTGSLGQFEHLRQPTASATKAKIESYLTSNPVGAQNGNLIFTNLQTLKNERDVSQGVLDKHASKLKSKYPLAFRHAETANDAEKLLSDWSSAPAPIEQQVVGINHRQQTVVPPSSHPQTAQAIEWANDPKNKDDIRAKTIRENVGAEKNAGL